MKVYCTRCKNSTNHTVTHELHEDWRNDYEGFFGYDNWQIVRCMGCDSVSFRHEIIFSEDMDQEGNIVPTVNIYPKRGEKMLTAKNYYNVDILIRNIYKETIECFNNQSNVLCAVGIRAIIEGICKSEGIKSGKVEIKNREGKVSTKIQRNLQGKISGLYEKGLITERYSKILHELRFLGNEAAHELSTPSSEELQIALSIIEHTIDNLYELEERAAQLKYQASIRRK